MSRYSVDEDDGFSLVELVVALTILAVAMLGVGEGLLATMVGSSVARERSVATALVSGDIAKVESLPFAALEAGLNPSVDSLGADPEIASTVSGTGTSYVFKPTGATIPATSSASTEPPLVPHVATVTLSIPYKVATYPTVDTSTPGLVTVVVVVSWTTPSGNTVSLTGEAEVSAP
ncbi:MAG: type IV pilus modification PilV family protein [Acidimicrobiales bacterium]